MPSVLITVYIFTCHTWILIDLHFLLEVILQEANSSNWAVDTLLNSLLSIFKFHIRLLKLPNGVCG